MTRDRSGTSAQSTERSVWRRSPATILIAVALAAALVAPRVGPVEAHQGDGSDPGLIHACVKPHPLNPDVWRRVHIVGPDGTCRSGESAVHWPATPVGGAVPVGGLIPFAGATSPSASLLLCDGAAVSRTGFAALFAVIGTTYGAGDGSTTFNLPDLRGRAPVGRGTSEAVDALGENEGLPVGSRDPHHRHGKGNLSIPSGGAHSHGLRLDSAPDANTGAMWMHGNGNFIEPAGNMVTPSSHSHPSSEFAGEVGNLSGPLDTAPYVVTNYLIRAF